MERKGNKGKKKKELQSRILLKGCNQGQSVSVLAILECVEGKRSFCRPTIVADNIFQCPIAPPL